MYGPQLFYRHSCPRNLAIRSYDGTVIVNRSIELQQPVIYVSMNYR